MSSFDVLVVGLVMFVAFALAADVRDWLRRREPRHPLFSERHVAGMGRVRRAIHRVLAAVYFGVPIYHYPPGRLSRAWMLWWRTYRRTWPQ